MYGCTSQQAHERTTTVPLLDDFEKGLAIVTSFALGTQVRRGNLTCSASCWA